MTEKIIIPLYDEDVAPRFDLATEVLILYRDRNESDWNEKIIVLPKSSAEQLCHLILTEEARTVICGGIEEEYYQYLTWKRVTVIDSVIGPWTRVLKAFQQENLKSGDILFTPDLS